MRPYDGAVVATRRRALNTIAVTVAVLGALAACGPAQPTATPTMRTPAPTPTPTPTPSPTPDSESVSVAATGVGTYLLAAIPVAVIHNDAHAHAATGVIVHFTTHRGNGSQLGSLDAVPVNLLPGETLAVAANCTDACNNAAGANVTVTVGHWLNVGGIAVTAAGATYQCGTCRPGHGYGHVDGMLSAAGLASNAAVVAFAVCHDAGGGILGGGTSHLIWPGGGTFAVEVSVVINDTPSSCELGASTGW
jgi:hypothetical protein